MCMMAAGRGEFFRSFLTGLDRASVWSPPDERRPVRGRGKPSRPGGSGGDKRSNRRPKGLCVSGHDSSWPPLEMKAEFPKMKTPSSKENLLERLPHEILIKILSFLDVSSLCCVNHVSKLFNRLANDDVLWSHIYTSEFGSQSWRPKAAVDDVVGSDPDRSPGRWKRTYFRSIEAQHLNKWKRQLRDISPCTGLPRQTEWVLKNLNVCWELTVCDSYGREATMEQSKVYFFESSAIVRWSGGSFPLYHHINSIQVHGVRKEPQHSPKDRKPCWRSLISKLDVKTFPGRYVGKDRVLKLMQLNSGFSVGVWRGTNGVAFIMVSLHFHRLVERSLLGSPVCPYSEPVDIPPVDDADPEFGLHGYALHFVLHSTGTEIMSGNFNLLSCRRVNIRNGLVELKVIDRFILSQHRPLSGSIKQTWKIESLEGAVENSCIITLTLLDEFQKPFWCVSAPACLSRAKRSLSLDYSGEQFVMEHREADGQVKMALVWLKEQKQFFLIGLTVYVSVRKVNRHFSRTY